LAFQLSGKYIRSIEVDDILKSNSNEKRQTYILLLFARAFLVDLHTKNINKKMKPDMMATLNGDNHRKHSQLPVVSHYKKFLAMAGRLQIFNPQLELLLHYTYNRLQKMDTFHADHYLVKIPYPIVEVPFYISTLDPKQDSHFSFDMHRTGKWEHDTTTFLFKYIINVLIKETKNGVNVKNTKKTMIDVGANLGYFSLLAASYNYTVLSFEPVSAHTKQLLKSTYINGFDDYITVFENIISTSSEEMKINPYTIGPSPTAYVSFKSDENDSSDAINFHSPNGGVVVKATTVDKKVSIYKRSQKMREERQKKTIRKANDINNNNKKETPPKQSEIDVKIIKIDCEGCEFDAFISSLNVIQTYKPELLIEVCPFLFKRCRTTPRDEKTVWNNLLNLHYRIYIYFHERDIPIEFKNTNAIKLEYKNGETLHVNEVPLRNSEDLNVISTWIEREKKSNACFQLFMTQHDLYQQKLEAVQNGGTEEL
jgi:FkbM family methyltransferase